MYSILKIQSSKPSSKLWLRIIYRIFNSLQNVNLIICHKRVPRITKWHTHSHLNTSSFTNTHAMADRGNAQRSKCICDEAAFGDMREFHFVLFAHKYFPPAICVCVFVCVCATPFCAAIEPMKCERIFCACVWGRLLFVYQTAGNFQRQIPKNCFKWKLNATALGSRFVLSVNVF